MSARSASEQLTRFDNQMAQAATAVGEMKEAYEQMAHDNAEEQKEALVAAIKVLVISWTGMHMTHTVPPAGTYRVWA